MGAGWLKRVLLGLGGLVLATGAFVPVAARSADTTTTVAAIERGEAGPAVHLEGAALYQLAAGQYLFSDGTGVVVVDGGRQADGRELPLFELIIIDGTVEPGDGQPARIEIGAWEALRIVRPAVIVPEGQVIADFQAWIVDYGGQAPVPTASAAPVE